jgi:hypothetical protein
VDINTYLPDELGERAKAAGLNFSGLLRGAVSEELEHREALAKASKDAEEYLLPVETEPETFRFYTARLVGKLLAEDEEVSVEIYVTEDGRVFAYEGSRRLTQLGVDPVTTLEQELEALLGGGDNSALIKAATALGIKITVDV